MGIYFNNVLERRILTNVFIETMKLQRVHFTFQLWGWMCFYLNIYFSSSSAIGEKNQIEFNFPLWWLGSGDGRA